LDPDSQALKEAADAAWESLSIPESVSECQFPKGVLHENPTNPFRSWFQGVLKDRIPAKNRFFQFCAFDPRRFSKT